MVRSFIWGYRIFFSFHEDSDAFSESRGTRGELESAWVQICSSIFRQKNRVRGGRVDSGTVESRAHAFARLPLLSLPLFHRPHANLIPSSVDFFLLHSSAAMDRPDIEREAKKKKRKLGFCPFPLSFLLFVPLPSVPFLFSFSHPNHHHPYPFLPSSLSHRLKRCPTVQGTTFNERTLPVSLPPPQPLELIRISNFNFSALEVLLRLRAASVRIDLSNLRGL